jgi:disulfide bond formation protein DsbB
MYEDRDLIRNKKYLMLLLGASLAALVSAYALEYGLDLAPCILCVYQRIPYFLILIIAVIGRFFYPRIAAMMIYICVILLVIEVGAAFYHISIEHGWLLETSKCTTTSSLENKSIEEAKSIILQEVASCSKPSLLLLTLSLAEWNLLYSSGLAIYLIISLLKRHKNDNQASR